MMPSLPTVSKYLRQQIHNGHDHAGVDLNGTIVITRYGGIFRGLKVFQLDTPSFCC